MVGDIFFTMLNLTDILSYHFQALYKALSLVRLMSRVKGHKHGSTGYQTARINQSIGIFDCDVIMNTL